MNDRESFKDSLKIDWLDKKYYDENGNVTVENILKSLGVASKLAENPSVQWRIYIEMQEYIKDAKSPEERNEILISSINKNLKRTNDGKSIGLETVELGAGGKKFLREDVYKLNSNGEVKIDSVYNSQDFKRYLFEKLYNKDGLLVEVGYTDIYNGYSSITTRDEENPFIISKKKIDYAGAKETVEIYLTDEKSILTFSTNSMKKLDSNDIQKLRKKYQSYSDKIIEKISKGDSKKYNSLIATASRVNNEGNIRS